MCQDCSDDPRGVCFYHKLRTLSWGSVPGGARQRSGYDQGALDDQFGDPQAIENYVMETTEGLGPLRWRNGEAFRKDRTTGDYQKVTASEFDRLMYGDKRTAEEDRRASSG